MNRRNRRINVFEERSNHPDVTIYDGGTEMLEFTKRIKNIKIKEDE